MADERLRRSERDARLAGPDARARRWIERVRGGELTADELDLAAFLGDDAACLATGGAPVSGSLRRRCLWLGRWGPVPCALAAAVACEQAIRAVADERAPIGEVGTAVIGAMRRWCARPGADQAEELARLIEGIPWPVRLERAQHARGHSLLQVGAALSEAGRIVAGEAPGGAASSAITLAACVMSSERWRSVDRPLEALDDLEREVGDEVWRAIATELLDGLEARGRSR